MSKKKRKRKPPTPTKRRAAKAIERVSPSYVIADFPLESFRYEIVSNSTDRWDWESLSTDLSTFFPGSSVTTEATRDVELERRLEKKFGDILEKKLVSLSGSIDVLAYDSETHAQRIDQLEAEAKEKKRIRVAELLETTDAGLSQIRPTIATSPPVVGPEVARRPPWQTLLERARAAIAEAATLPDELDRSNAFDEWRRLLIHSSHAPGVEIPAPYGALLGATLTAVAKSDISDFSPEGLVAFADVTTLLLSPSLSEDEMQEGLADLHSVSLLQTLPLLTVNEEEIAELDAEIDRRLSRR